MERHIEENVVTAEDLREIYRKMAKLNNKQIVYVGGILTGLEIADSLNEENKEKAS